MKGPSGELWAKIISRKNATSTKIIGMIHHILLRQRKSNSRLMMEKRILTEETKEDKNFMKIE